MIKHSVFVFPTHFANAMPIGHPLAFNLFLTIRANDFELIYYDERGKK